MLVMEEVSREDNPLALFAPHPATLGKDQADPENRVRYPYLLLPFHFDPDLDCNYRLSDLVEEQYGLSDRDDLGQRSASGGGSSGGSMGPCLDFSVVSRWRFERDGRAESLIFFTSRCLVVIVWSV